MAEEEKDEVLDKKAAKAQEKAARAEAKAQKKADRKKAKELNDDLDMDDETSTGGKIAVFFVTLIIILIWLAIIVLLIKCDVGGFGSSVLAPVLKDVPYVNKILPDSATEEVSTEDDAYGYTSIDDAVARIKELEKELADAQNTSSANAEYIAQLESQSAELAQYKQNEADFEAEKQKFYQEVVFSDSAPDIEEYKQYYESIDPADAEIIYRQVEMDDYVKAYSSMKPKEAAAIFDTMTDNLQLVADILDSMDAQSRANILGKMDAATAAKVTAIMEPVE